VGRVVYRASCPWGEIVLGRVVHGASCEWGKLTTIACVQFLYMYAYSIHDLDMHVALMLRA
jgi:hypothetical protein